MKKTFFSKKQTQITEKQTYKHRQIMFQNILTQNK